MLISSISVMGPIGLAIGGPVADAFGVRVLFLAAGVGCLVVALVWGLTPAILYLEDSPQAGAPGPSS